MDDAFQSLFFWNSRPDGLPGAQGASEIRVSILVFLELAPGHLHAERYVTDEPFQSLFFWNSRPDEYSHSRPSSGE